MNMLELFFTQITPVAFIALVGLTVFFSSLSFIASARPIWPHREWDWKDGVDAAKTGALLVLALMLSAWVSGLVVCLLIELFGGVTSA